LIEEVGVICAVDHQGQKQIVWVETQVKSTCGKCEAQANCGTSSIAKAFAHKPEKLRFEMEGTVVIGQEVSLGIPEESLLKASFLMYLLPLIVLVFSVLVGQQLLPSFGYEQEGWLILFAAICSYGAYRYVRQFISSTDQTRFYPQILSILPVKSGDIDVKQL
jgi:sigma-E factor negative regulatory protein RseC